MVEITDDHSDDSDYQFSNAYDSIEDVSAHEASPRRNLKATI